MANLSPGDPRRWVRVSKALLVMAPIGGIFAYGFAALQGAEMRSRLIVTAMMVAMCLGRSLLYYLRGSKATGDIGWISFILRLLAGR
jgi:hypothetical protein